MTGTIVIPNKNLFKMNEVCSITGVKPYVLRFWETEFSEIRPSVSSSGQKLFSQSDIEVIVLIKKLLFEDKKTIDAAKAELILNYSFDELEVNELPDLPEEALSHSEEDMNHLANIEQESVDLEDALDSTAMVSQQLQSYDIEKLVMAKSKLNNLLDTINDLKSQQNWS